MRLNFIRIAIPVCLLTCGCIATRRDTTVEQMDINAVYATYHAAMGQTKGLLFKITVTDKSFNGTPFAIDSLILHNKAVPFNLLQEKPGMVRIECNLSKPKREPELSPEGKVIYPPEISDPVIDHHDFYPARIQITRKGSVYRIPIKQFTLSNP